MTLKLRSRLRSPAAIEDAKQETFVRVLTSLKKKRSLATPETLGAFVNATCNNVVFELYRSGARTTPLPDEYDEPDNRRRGADSAMLAVETLALERYLLGEMPGEERDAFEEHFFSCAECAEEARAGGVMRDAVAGGMVTGVANAMSSRVLPMPAPRARRASIVVPWAVA